MRGTGTTIDETTSANQVCPACGNLVSLFGGGGFIWWGNCRYHLECAPYGPQTFTADGLPMPWICPRCQMVNAPHVRQCTCTPLHQESQCQPQDQP